MTQEDAHAPALPLWDVVICGAGPAGLTLGNHLGVLGLKVLIVERLPALLDYPRGVGIDDESLRSFQSVGLVDAVRRHTVPHQILSFIDRRGRTLAAMAPSAQPFGWPRRNGFIQPRVDRELARGLAAFAHVQLRLGTAMERFEEQGERIALALRACDADGEPTGPAEQHHARYLVGCDGGRSSVRHGLGLPFEGRSESTRWLVIDLADDPIGTLNAAFVLDDDIPHVTMGLPHGVRRYEFMVPDGADEQAVSTPAHAREMLRRVLPPGVEPSIIRHRVYTHHARIAPTFRKGRALIAGDAAHLMPVWQGQGFNTGIRDVTNLGWKLALVASGRAGERLLDSYTEERHAHASAMIDLSVLTGRIFVPAHPLLKAVRNIVAPAIARIGPLRRYITEMRFKPMPFFRRGAVLHPGAVPDPRSGVGRMFIQPWVADAAGRRMRLDDAIGLRFALLSWSVGAEAWLDDAARGVLRQLDALPVVVKPACQLHGAAGAEDGTVLLADEAGEFKRWFDHAPGPVVLLRPDRVVAAICQPCNLNAALQALATVMDLRPPRTGAKA